MNAYSESMEEGDENELVLLQQLETILASDPLIDELGFLHPVQIASLHEGNPQPELQNNNVNTSVFWCADHKLAIAMPAVAPMYKAAKHEFLTIIKQYEDLLTDSGHCSPETVESSIRKLLSSTRSLVVLNSSYKGAWDARKRIFKDMSTAVPLTELKLSSLTLSFNFKCEDAWAYRRWVIQQRSLSEQNVGDLLKEEFRLIEMTAERSRMNYRAWHHCCWLVSLMSSSQILNALQLWKKWAQLHAADNCCFHFRRCLLQSLLNKGKEKELKEAWLDEIDWCKKLITLYIGREALWVHRRFLFFIWIQYVKPNGISALEEASDFDETFSQNEISFVNECILSCSNDENEESQKQLTYACTYKLWILVNEIKYLQKCRNVREELKEVMQLLKLKASVYHNLWEGLLSSSLCNI